ncbi:MAG: 3-keto-5-aminohexanoate cleavage protein [Candidatus Eremiobacteraeota bacterium]|nr:3-keto-5-aminohexanoate cleavage protein [Candidatus Eremiobacteraeota bacterium]
MIVQKKRIITCAITGAIHTPSMTPYLPISPDEIAREAIAAAEAGAAIIHLHARRPERDELHGFPDWRPETYLAFCRQIAEHTDAIVNITSGGGPGFTWEQRMAGPIALSPEITSFNLGCVNFGLFPLVEKIPKIEFAWERQFLEATKGAPYINSFAMMQELGTFGKTHGVRFEYECFDVGHLNALKLCKDQGWLPEGPLFLQCVLGVPGGLGGDVEHLVHMKATAERLFGSDFQMSALGAGKYQMTVAAGAASLGMHVRVGLEDSTFIGRGQLATGNAQQVRKVRQILDALSLEPATPAEAREMLKTKGSDKTAFALAAVR